MKIEFSAEEVTLLRAALRSHHDKMWSQVSELKRPHQGYDVTLFETWRKWADESLALSKRIGDEAAHPAPEAQAEGEMPVAWTALRNLYTAYVRLLEIGRDRIIELGGKCDPVDVMERNDPELIQARRAMADFLHPQPSASETPSSANESPSAKDAERVLAYLAESSNERYVFHANDDESLDAYTADGFRITELVKADPDAPATFNPVYRVMFRAGLLACREYMARFVESESPTIATSIRANWWPALGDDPGAPRLLRFDEVADGGEEGPWTHKQISVSVEALPHAFQFLAPGMQAAIAAQRKEGESS